jgi:hypothetical protein
VIVSFNLERSLGIIGGLAPGGVLGFETLTMNHLKSKPEFKPDFFCSERRVAEDVSGTTLIKVGEADLEVGRGKPSVASILAKKNWLTYLNAFY